NFSASSEAENAVIIPPEILGHIRQAMVAQQQYRDQRDPAALNVAADAVARALSASSFASTPTRFQARVLSGSASIQMELYLALGGRDHLDTLIDMLRLSVALVSPETLDYILYLKDLGIGLYHRYGSSGQSADLDEAVEMWREAAKRMPPEAP